ncbi:hypothetical protein FRC08_001101 [Ceratobasidium sp. 394]|nr:hypothetical protein FRC08_001101 [Ceratobasidium sp. 394]
MSPSAISSPNRGPEDMPSAGHYPGDCSAPFQYTAAPGEQAKWNTPGAFYPYLYPYYMMDMAGHPHYFNPYGPPVAPPTPFAGSTVPTFGQYPASQPYHPAPAPYHPYSGYSRPGYPHPPTAAPQSAYTYPAPLSSPTSSRSTPPPPPINPSSTRSITPPAPSTSPRPQPALLTPSEFIHQLDQIRLENRPAGPVGRFHILGEGLPVSISLSRKGGPFLIQHYLPDGRADVISVAHVFEFKGGAERGVIVWCPPPRVQYFG